MACPVLVWDLSCRDRLSALAWEHWDQWKGRTRVGVSLRWMPTMLPEELLLPDEFATEPCVAGLYFKLFAKEPGFLLEKEMVEGFLVCSVEVGWLASNEGLACTHSLHPSPFGGKAGLGGGK